VCAIIYYLALNRHAQKKLQKELDEQLGSEDELVATGQQVKRLPYLDSCINEGLRLHSTSALGLPRVVPKGGLTVMDQYFPEGTVLSVPSYSIHRDARIWGEDFEDYRPERWFERDQADIQKTFNPFSIGPRYVDSPPPPFDINRFVIDITELVSGATSLSWNFKLSLGPLCGDSTLSFKLQIKRSVLYHVACSFPH